MPVQKGIFSSHESLIALISLILLAGFLITTMSSYYVSRGSLRDTLITNELPLTSNNIYSEIQRDLLQPVFVSSLMANDTLVKDWLLDGEQDLDKITRYLEQIHRKYGVFTSFLVSDQTRNYYHYSGISQVVSESDPRDAWYFRVREMEPDYELNVDQSAEQGDALTIFINYKVRDYDGKFIAAVGVGLAFNTVATIVERYRKSFGRHIYFIDEEGNIPVRSAGTSVTEDNILSARGMSEIAAEILHAERGFFEYDRDGEQMLLSTRLIPELGWHVIVEQREADALNAIRQTLITNLLIGLSIIVVTILIISYAIGRYHKRLRVMATTDKLTGIGNRSVFDMVLHQAISRFQRDTLPFAVMLVDIDHFKRINDSFGHLQGDQVLKDIVVLIQQTLRDSDVLCRWGGDEFILLAHNCNLENATGMAGKICQAVEAAELIKYPDGKVATVSLGVTVVGTGDVANSVIQRADEALYQAKQAGRNSVKCV